MQEDGSSGWLYQLHLADPFLGLTYMLLLSHSLGISPCAGLKATGLAGIWWQLLALAIAVFPVWLTQLGARIPEASTTHVLLGGLVASRFGLWLFDLAVSQMLQEWVTPEELGKLLSWLCGSLTCQ